MATVNITDENFDTEVLKSNKPIVVDFWAEWCGPCKMLTPVINEIANEFSDDFSIGKLNVDENSDIAAQYGIRSIPCLLFFKNGKVEKQIVGAVEKTEISTILNELK